MNDEMSTTSIGMSAGEERSVEAHAGDGPAPATGRGEPTEAPVTAPQVPEGGLEIVVDHRDRICYALAYNRVPTIRSITVRNVTAPSTGQLTIAVEIRWTVADLQPMQRQEIVLDMPVRGEALTIDGASFRLDDAALVDLVDAANAMLVVTVTDGVGAVQRLSRDVVVLARNQWINDPDIYMLTSAFVQPNHPSVNEILRDASSILSRETGSGSLEGYQSGPNRAVQLGAAVFEALQGRVDRYVNPPAVYAQEGQKLRPLDEVLEFRQGTCLDLACAYASCLAAAGLHPVVALVHGHAFTGFFLNLSTSAILDSVVLDFPTIISLFESTDHPLVGVEATLLAGNDDFSVAVQRTQSHRGEREVGCRECEALASSGVLPPAEPHLEALVNISKCFRAGVLPLPSRVIRDGVVTIVIDNGPASAPIIERRDERTRKLLPNVVPARVQQWKQSLLDLSFRNALLNYRPAKTGIELLAPESSVSSIEDALIGGASVSIVPSDEVSQLMQAQGIRAAQNIQPDDLRKVWTDGRTLFGALEAGAFVNRVRNLRAKAVAEEQDSGVNNLYLTLGSLKWSDPKSATGEVRSPIFLVPIRLVVKRGSKVATIVADEAATTSVNYCLIEALRAKRGMRLAWFSDDMSDDSGLDVRRGLEEIRTEIIEQGFTQHGFEVVEDASIGLLRFNKIRLWKDLDDHWELFSKNPIVEHLIAGRRGQQFADPNDPERTGAGTLTDSDLLNPQPADGAQSRAISRALAKQSFVLEGPPGTGKSQTITNLLANALAKGQRVLFVAEKQAALEVVKERLAEVGLDPFCLDLHDKGSSPADIKRQLREALEFQPAANMAAWDTNCERFDAAARVLAAYRDKLHGANTNGASYYEAYAELLDIGDGPTATVSRGLFRVDAARISSWRDVLNRIDEYATVVRPRPGHPWMLVGGLALDSAQREGLRTAIVEVGRHLGRLDEVSSDWRTLLAAATSLGELAGIVAVMRAVSENALPPAEHWRTVASPSWIEAARGSLNRLSAHLESVADLTASMGPDFLLRDDSALQTALTVAATSFVVGRKGRVRAALGALASHANFAGATPEQALATVNRMVSAASGVRVELAALQALPGVVLPLGWSPSVDGSVLHAHRHLAFAHSAGMLLASGSELGARVNEAVNGRTSLDRANVETAAGLSEAMLALCTSLSASTESTRRWTNGRGLVAAARDSLSEWTADVEHGGWLRLNRWLELVNHVALLDDISVAQFRDELLDGSIPSAEAGPAFRRALLNVTMLVVGEDHAFDVFDHASHNRRVREFTSLLRERENLLRTVIPKMLHSGRTFEAASNVGAVGQLRTELNSRGRGARSVRALISRYPDLIASLAPCFLMSPDSIAKFIEPGKLNFDLVVFDEASQITVSSAVGALGRAAAAVIVGDSKQMPPTSVGVAAVGDDGDEAGQNNDEEAVITDAESILDECLESGLEQEWLAWHYRSRDEILIKFSNDKYYGEKLSSFPSPWQRVPFCGLSYRRVDGQFDHGGRRTNEIEARAIVGEVQRRANDPELKKYSIGIVTLNLEQRELVQTLLSELKDAAVAALLDSEDDTENLFVLNLESVQGRERDVILMGTSFSARSGGGKMPLSFGPLTLKGGERRLNVAVTRARREVVVFSSFDPEALAEATSLGMKHLYEYLKLARAANEGTRPETTAPDAPGDARYREEVATALRARGLIVETGIGMSSFKVDLGVTLPGFEDRRLVGVLLDGRVWASRPLALDRDALPATVLEKVMGWPRVMRVWLPSWRKNAEEIVEDIYDAALAVRDGQPGPVEPGAEIDGNEIAPLQPVASEQEATENGNDRSGDRPIVASGDSETASAEGGAQRESVDSMPVRSGVAPEREFVSLPELSSLGTVVELEARSPKAREALARLAEEHGPLQMKKALKLVAGGFGLTRVFDARLVALAEMANPRHVVRTEFGDFLFPSAYVDGGAVRSEFDWFRRSSFSDRTVEEVAPHEMANLFRSITAASFSIGRTELAKAALDALGYGRRTEPTVAFVESLIDWSVRNGRLASDGEMITVPAQ